MAIVVEQTRSKADGGTSTDTISDTMTGIDAASHVLLVCHSGADGVATPPSGYTEAFLAEDLTGSGPGAGAQCVAVYWKASPSSSESPSIVFNQTEDHGMYMLEVSGLLASPEDAGKENHNYRGQDSSRTNAPGTTGTLTQANNIVLAYCWAWAGDNGMTIDGSFSEDPGDIHDGFLNLLTAHLITSATTALNPTTTWDTDDADSGAVIVTFKEDAATEQFIDPGLTQQLAVAFDPVVIGPEQFFTPGLAQQLAVAFDPTDLLRGVVFITPGLAQSLAVAHDPVMFIQQFVTPGLATSLATAFDPVVIGPEQFATPGLAQSLVAASDPVVLLTARPDGTVAAGGWDTGPTPAGNLHDNAGDDSDATWIEDTPA